ncbi:zinc fingers and homeoboxes protein 3 [Gouania willdenowi]|uniref:zinc fingers and homeoboxes protein 3 n=1 Tax=Gouania willdenowi TaxID=441366 RepID=UPI00105551D1|nr:zinc fingers and homeoboxes protein 3-like [Gouania willdenowi]XP_028301797.1 zinc fingers and homeoboxes protein 3-like [Gouania willdenowi]XP_028301798.1 zinc fingers and homeoboxes protein 3-like [Gouania willdenowi]XP_028301799.1 zinc fingers and homeoboxes protein 3-like [Gouania willdenowi]
MASKRKSTVPCMIPSKSKHVREEIILGSLPELLPTIPEDSILSISGDESGHVSHSFAKPESCSEVQKGGTYSCVTCRFESRDLNYFLDHMHNCHLDFRAQPTFFCLNCRVSVVRFEALALHNANAHPKIMEGVVTASLAVNKREGITTVEQSLFTDAGDDYKESGISLTKTPIAKMMKAKGEHKKIVVSHTVEVRKLDTGKDVDPSSLTNVPELQNGAYSISVAPAMPRTTVSHTSATTVSNQVFHQHTPSLYSSPSSDSNKDLPKVMIPLSSIPTYDAAMDTSSFLKTTFGKFPYPTKAELCYLTVVSEFPEEQIKLWFTAQRLKQGISWSPEEIEEARRKMFNTVFQGGAPQRPPVAPRHVNHIIHHHTVTAHTGSKGPNFPVARLPFGSIKPRPVGAIATQASLSTNPHVTRVSYSTPIIPQRFPPVVRTAQVLTKNTEPTVEPHKTNGLDVAGSSGCVGSTSSSRSSSSCSSSSSSISSYSNSSNGVDAVLRKSTDGTTNALAMTSASISNNDEHCVADTHNLSMKGNSFTAGVEESDSTKSTHVIIDNTSRPNITCNNHNSSSVTSHESSNTNNPEEKNGNHVPETNNSNDHSTTACFNSVLKQNHASKSQTNSTSTIVVTKSRSSILEESKCNKDFPMKGMSILQQLIKENDSFGGERSCPEFQLDPIKINFKRLKMNEPEAKSETAHQEHKPETAEVSAGQPCFSPSWANKTPQQLNILRQVFSSSRWPSSQQYEELSAKTGLPKSEVVRWFSDSRYSYKNGQLKWLDTYQRPPTVSEGSAGHAESEAAAPKEPSLAKMKLVEQEMNKHLEGKAELNSGQRFMWQESYSPLLRQMGSQGSGERGRLNESAQLGALQDSWSETVEDHQQPLADQSLLDQQTDANQARDRPRMELLEV